MTTLQENSQESIKLIFLNKNVCDHVKLDQETFKQYLHYIDCRGVINHGLFKRGSFK